MDTNTADLSGPIPVFRQSIIDNTINKAKLAGYIGDGSLIDLQNLFTNTSGREIGSIWNNAVDKVGLFADWYNRLT